MGKYRVYELEFKRGLSLLTLTEKDQPTDIVQKLRNPLKSTYVCFRPYKVERVAYESVRSDSFN